MLRDIINRRLVTTEPDAKISQVAKIMDHEDVGAVLVLDNEKPRGIITDRDIVLRCVAKNLDVDDTTVENVMTESLEVVRETDGIFDCIRTMRAAQARRIPVVDEKGKAIGLVSFGDLLAMLGKEMWMLTERTTPLDEEAKVASMPKPSRMKKESKEQEKKKVA